MTDYMAETKRTDFKVELLVVFSILISLGFPGTFAQVYGARLATLMEYTAFLTQIAAMILSSGNNWLNIQVINLDRRYAILYLYGIVIFAESMLATRFPSAQMVTCARLMVTIFFAIWLQEQFPIERMVELIGYAQLILVMSIVAMMVLHNGMAFENGSWFRHALRGIFTSKNTCGSVLAFGILITIYLIRLKREKRERYDFWVAFLAVQVMLLMMCQATGAVLCAIVALVVSFQPNNLRAPLGWGFVACNIGFLFAVLTLMPHLEWLFYALGKDPTLTGRVPMWNRVITIMTTHHPFIGYGYAMFWRDTKAVAIFHAGFDEFSYLGTMTYGAHNVLMEFWLNSGLIGIAMFLTVWVVSLRNIDKVPRKRYMFSSAIAVWLMVNCLSERGMCGNFDYKTLLFLLAMATCCNRSADLDEDEIPVQGENMGLGNIEG